MAAHSENRDWRTLADQASKETNPEKLVDLIEQLWFAIDDHETSNWVTTVHRASLRRVRHSALLQTALKSFDFRHALQISARTTSVLKNFMSSIQPWPAGIGTEGKIARL